MNQITKSVFYNFEKKKNKLLTITGPYLHAEVVWYVRGDGISPFCESGSHCCVSKFNSQKSFLFLSVFAPANTHSLEKSYVFLVSMVLATSSPALQLITFIGKKALCSYRASKVPKASKWLHFNFFKLRIQTSLYKALGVAPPIKIT